MPSTVYHYRGYLISYDPETYLPASLSWSATHQDYDGGYYESDGTLSDESDMRHTREKSLEACKEWIDWKLDE